MPQITNDIKTEVNVKFFCSATVELIASLHVISDPSHHKTTQNWYETTIGEMSPELLTKINEFGKKYVNWSFVMDIADYLVTEEVGSLNIKDDFDEIYDKLNKMDDYLFVYIFLGETLIGEKNLAKQLIKNPNHIDKYDFSNLYPFIAKEDVRDFLFNYKKIKKEMLEIMREYHESIFSIFWEMISTHYWGKIKTEQKLLQTSSPIDYILALHKDLIYENNRIVMNKEYPFSLQGSSIREIRLFFSMFTFPHLMATVYENSISIYENLIFPQTTDKSEELVQSIKPFSDVNRMMILKLISQNPSTNKEMAKILGIAPASVSQHLKILRDAGAVSSKRSKNTIYYNLNADMIQKTFSELCEYLNINN